MIAILVGLASALVLALILSGFTGRKHQTHHDGDYVSPSYRARIDRACRSEFDAHRYISAR